MYEYNYKAIVCYSVGEWKFLLFSGKLLFLKKEQAFLRFSSVYLLYHICCNHVLFQLTTLFKPHYLKIITTSVVVITALFRKETSAYNFYTIFYSCT